MKKHISKLFILLAGLSLTLSACHKLDQPVKTELDVNSFPTRPEHFAALSADVYGQLRSRYAIEFWQIQSLSTDECILPTFSGGWWDGGKCYEMHTHTWTPNNAIVSYLWSELSMIGTKATTALSLFAKAPESAEKRAAIAELRTMRAYGYYLMMDLWGNIPLSTTFGDTARVLIKPRAEVFAYIEKEVKESLPDLTTKTDAAQYGRANKYTGFALLAKLYLNAAVYTGTPRWNDAVAMCDSVMKSGKYQLETDYLGMFKPNNGHQIKEFIFTVPFDPRFSSGVQYFARYWLPNALRAKYSIPTTASWSSCVSVLPEFYAYYNDANDVRNKIWLTGQQYNYDGTPIKYDATHNLIFTSGITIKTPPFETTGSTDKALSLMQGYRCNKFYPDSTNQTSRNQSNDVPVFRYADILLMKAEAIQRGATATNGETALSLTNTLRAKRGAASFASITLDDIYGERCREFANENWHRNDMIRFGKFEDKWGFKTNTETYRRIFPIPADAINANPNLVQNPGYN